MQCPERRLESIEEYLHNFAIKSERLRIPLSGSLELTHCCNLQCVHCYLGRQSLKRTRRAEEIGTKRILALLDEIAEAGCLYILFTGGEPFLREDFPEIYRHAKENGLLVTVFSNGTLVNNNLVELFSELPPVEVEISLYGASASVYEQITLVPGSFERCLNGIKRLKESSINVNIKTVLMTMNEHEFHAIEDISKEYGIGFRFDAAISPCIDGGKTPLDLRVSPKDAIDKEFSDPGRRLGWQEYFKKNTDNYLGDALYGCGAGITGFHVDPYGYLYPCMMTLDIRHNLLLDSFLTGWNDIISNIRDRKTAADFACRKCDKINLCGYCPAFFRMETGFEEARSEYLCTMGGLRFEKLMSSCSKGGSDDGD